MKLNKLFLESIAELPLDCRVLQIREDAHGQIGTETPAELPFHKGDTIDLGTENLGLTKAQRWAIHKALAAHGTAIPGTPYRIRVNVQGRYAIEPATGEEEATLPPNWMEGLLVARTQLDQIQYVWIGNKVRPNQLTPDFDYTPYLKTKEGWHLAPDLDPFESMHLGNLGNS